MNSKKIIVYQYDILFNILNEIKEKLYFDVVKADKNLSKFENDSTNDFLIISKDPINNHANNFVIHEIPIKIEKLIEQINLRLLKDRFNAQSEIEIGNYKINLNSREISNKAGLIPLTEREINLILFLKNSKKAVGIEELQKKVWEYGSELETHTVETHIYRLRKKIKEKFGDENFILSLKEGYSIK